MLTAMSVKRERAINFSTLENPKLRSRSCERIAVKMTAFRLFKSGRVVRLKSFVR